MKCTHLLAFKWYTKQDDALQAFLDEWTNEALQTVDTPAALARQTRDFDASVEFVSDEDWIHKHALGQLAPTLP
jgi:hypothetical protein